MISPRIATLAENILDVVWDTIDVDHSGNLNGTEADMVALALNFLIGRAWTIPGGQLTGFIGDSRLQNPNLIF